MLFSEGIKQQEKTTIDQYTPDPWPGGSRRGVSGHHGGAGYPSQYPAAQKRGHNDSAHPASSGRYLTKTNVDSRIRATGEMRLV